MRTRVLACLLVASALVAGCTPPPDVAVTPAPTSPASTPAGGPSPRIVAYPGTASFVHGHTMRWTYEADSISFVLPGDTT